MITASICLTPTSPPPTARAKPGTDAPYGSVVLENGDLLIQSTDPEKLREAGWAFIEAAGALDVLISIRADVEAAREMNAANAIADATFGTLPPPFPRPLADGTAA